jgi:hypothetical protein
LPAFFSFALPSVPLHEYGESGDGSSLAYVHGKKPLIRLAHEFGLRIALHCIQYQLLSR